MPSVQQHLWALRSHPAPHILSLQVHALHAMLLCVAAGALAVLVAALDKPQQVAWHAFMVLRHLLASIVLPQEQMEGNFALLARMHGLRRVSNLLCPFFPAGQALQAQAGAQPPLSS